MYQQLNHRQNSGTFPYLFFVPPLVVLCVSLQALNTDIQNKFKPLTKYWNLALKKWYGQYYLGPSFTGLGMPRAKTSLHTISCTFLAISCQQLSKSLHIGLVLEFQNTCSQTLKNMLQASHLVWIAGWLRKLGWSPQQTQTWYTIQSPKRTMKYSRQSGIALLLCRRTISRYSESSQSPWACQILSKANCRNHPLCQPLATWMSGKEKFNLIDCSLLARGIHKTSCMERCTDRAKRKKTWKACTSHQESLCICWIECSHGGHGINKHASEYFADWQMKESLLSVLGVSVWA